MEAPLRRDDIGHRLDAGLVTLGEAFRRVESEGDLRAPLPRGERRLAIAAFSTAAVG